MNELRQAFETWFEASAMPSEADWFRRDPNNPDEYNLSFVAHAWDGFQAGFEVGARQAAKARDEATA